MFNRRLSILIPLWLNRLMVNHTNVEVMATHAEHHQGVNAEHLAKVWRITNEEADQTKSLKLTKYCRDQIIEPLLALIEQHLDINLQELVPTLQFHKAYYQVYSLIVLIFHEDVVHC